MGRGRALWGARWIVQLAILAASLIVAAPASAGTISGAVTEDGSGDPLDGICVTTFREGTMSGSVVNTNSSGQYSTSSALSGNYFVYFEDCTNELYIPEGFDDAWNVNAIAGHPAAQLVAVGPSLDAPNIDAALERDLTPPDTTFDFGPSATTTETSATIYWHYDALPLAFGYDLVTFECSLNGASFTQCGPGPYDQQFSVSGLSPGEYVLEVRGTDRAGNVEMPPVEGRWTVDPGATPGETTQTADPGGTVSSSPFTPPDPSRPVTTAVTTPTGGTVTIADEGTPTTPPPQGYSVLGHQFEITAPVETAGTPLRIVFDLDAAAIPSGMSASTISVLRDGQLAGECPGSLTADPDPCVSVRETLTGGDLRITVLSSHASSWNLAGPTPAAPSPPASGGATTPNSKKKCKKKKSKKRSASAAKKKKCKKK